MRNFLYILLLIIIFFNGFAQTHLELVNHWAPIHIQNVCKKGKNSLHGKSDELASFDFDGDWNALNNWENLEQFETEPAVYYHIKETDSSFFIMYAYFHPRDWTRFRFFKLGQHENDLEGVFFWIAKSDSIKYGNLKAVFTIFHNDILVYLPENSLSETQKKIKPRKVPVSYLNKRIVTMQQAKGHGVKLYEDLKLRKNKIVYIPKGCEYLTTNNFDATNKTYELIDIKSEGELVSQRENKAFFESNQTIKGNNGKGANPPWLWTDWNDGKQLPKGTLFTNPEKFAESYFRILGL